MSIEGRRAPAEDGLFIVGLTGGTGTGKSTVAQALAREGAVVLSGDALGHEVTDFDPEVRAALTAEYGPSVYRKDGALDRRVVAARVFRDAAARERLDRLVHPRLLEKIHGRLEELRAEGHRGTVVIDAALLLEWELESSCDAVVAVAAQESEQLARLERSRGWSAAEARDRLAAQRGPEEFAAAADAVLSNRGSIAELEASAREVVARLRARHAARGTRTVHDPMQ